METPNRKLLETIAKTVFPEYFKVDSQASLVLAFKWWREYVFRPDERLEVKTTDQVKEEVGSYTQQ